MQELCGGCCVSACTLRASSRNLCQAVIAGVFTAVPWLGGGCTGGGGHMTSQQEYYDNLCLNSARLH